MRQGEHNYIQLVSVNLPSCQPIYEAPDPNSTHAGWCHVAPSGCAQPESMGEGYHRASPPSLESCVDTLKWAEALRELSKVSSLYKNTKV